MAKTQSPLLGYNTNVRHKGKVFHIQTEDSGVAKPHVITHLFADGGRIIKSVKSSYADRLETPDLQTQVKKLMQDQHKAMFIALRDGVYDAQAEVAPAPEVAPDIEQFAATTPIAAEPVDDSIELDESSFVEEVVPAPVAVTPLPTPTPPLPPLPPSATMSGGPSRTGHRQSAGWSPATGRATPPLGAAPVGPPPLRPPPARATATAPLVSPATSTAPLAATGTTSARPEKRTPAPTARLAPVFGERLVSERSLDEVILSYLAEELGDTPKR
jgi:hypothetical protein